MSDYSYLQFGNPMIRDPETGAIGKIATETQVQTGSAPVGAFAPETAYTRGLLEGLQRVRGEDTQRGQQQGGMSMQDAMAGGRAIQQLMSKVKARRAAQQAPAEDEVETEDVVVETDETSS